MLHASYSIRFNLNSILRTARTELVPSLWAGNAARLIHFISGAYNSHSPLIFQSAFVSFGCLNVSGKLVGCTAVNTPSTPVLLPKVIMVVFHMPPLPSHAPWQTRENLDGIGNSTASLCLPPDLELLNVLHTSCLN